MVERPFFLVSPSRESPQKYARLFAISTVYIRHSSLSLNQRGGGGGGGEGPLISVKEKERINKVMSMTFSSLSEYSLNVESLSHEVLVTYFVLTCHFAFLMVDFTEVFI